MHAYTIAFTLAMAGSSMAAVLQNPPSTSTTTTTTDELRTYGPTCARFHGDDGPTCAGVGPGAHTAAVSQESKDSLTEERDFIKEFDINENGHIDDEDMALLEAAAGLIEELEKSEKSEKSGLGDDEDDGSDHVEPSTVHTAPPTVHTAPTTVQTAPPVRLAPPVVRVPVASKPDVPASPTCPSCPHPSVHNPNWNKLEFLNDTRKNINGFKLFATLDASPQADFPPHFAVHVREHEERKDIWNAKLFPEVVDQAVEGMAAKAGLNATEFRNQASPSQKAFLKAMDSFNSHQPRWNLADNRLETKSNDSAPVNDTLYFRLYQNKEAKDTTNIIGPIYRSMLTTNANKNKYGKEHNAKLVGKKSWQLKRDAKAPWNYRLLNKDIEGGFFWCIEQGKMEALEAKAKSMTAKIDAIESRAQNGQYDLQALQEVLGEAHQALGDHEGTELRFMNSNEKEVQLNKGATTCMAVTLKVR
jgi:hypothetical protein